MDVRHFAAGSVKLLHEERRRSALMAITGRAKARYSKIIAKKGSALRDLISSTRDDRLAQPA
jgi:hypothetical protein